MLRLLTILLLLGAMAACSVTPALSQLPLSVRVAAVGGVHQGELTASVDGSELGTSSVALYTAGVEIDVGTPLGINLGAHYLRHFGDLTDSFEEIPDALTFGLGANEFGIFAEKRISPVPASPVQPFLGVGVGYGRISLAQEFEEAGVSIGDLDGEIDVFRVYALGGLQVFGSLGVKARAGWMFGSIDGEELSFGQNFETESGQAVGFELDYGGAFASLAISLFGF